MTTEELLKKIYDIARELTADVVRLDKQYAEQLEELRERLSEKDDI